MPFLCHGLNPQITRGRRKDMAGQRCPPCFFHMLMIVCLLGRTQCQLVKTTLKSQTWKDALVWLKFTVTFSVIISNPAGLVLPNVLRCRDYSSMCPLFLFLWTDLDCTQAHSCIIDRCCSQEDEWALHSSRSLIWHTFRWQIRSQGSFSILVHDKHLLSQVQHWIYHIV